MPSSGFLLALFALVAGVVYWAERPNPNDCDPRIVAQLRARFGASRYERANAVSELRAIWPRA